MRPETYEVLVLSTAHLTEADNIGLGKMAKDPSENMVMERETGYFIKLYTADNDGFSHNKYPVLSNHFTRILHYADSIECLGIEFDCDAGTLGFLKTFNW